MITLQQLKYFRELAKNGHLTRTAEKLFITQTSLSNTIIHMEKELGVKLFDRVGRSLQLSEAGKKYYHYVDEALVSLANGHNMLEDYKENSEKSFSVAMTSSNVWAGLISDFQSVYQNYNLRQIDCDYTRFHSMLTEHKIDFVLAGESDMDFTGLEKIRLREEKLYLCVPKEHPLCEKKSIYLAEAKGESFINLPKVTGFRAFCDDLLEKARINGTSFVECDYMLRGKLVEVGCGVAITSDLAKTQGVMGNNVEYLPLLDSFARRPISLVWNPRHYLTHAARDFMDFVIRNMKE